MPSAAHDLLPPLREGERMTSDEFMRRWEAIPDLKHAELLDGVVHMPSPVGYRHNVVHPRIISWLIQYADATPGCQVGADGTWRMGPDSVPQPDATLRILTRGQSKVEKNYLTGAPELAVEVAYSSSARDLGIKSDIYRRYGVREYLVILAQENEVLWREVVKGRYRKLTPDSQGDPLRSVPRSVPGHRRTLGRGLAAPALEP